MNTQTLSLSLSLSLGLSYRAIETRQVWKKEMEITLMIYSHHDEVNTDREFCEKQYLFQHQYTYMDTWRV